MQAAQGADGSNVQAVSPSASHASSTGQSPAAPAPFDADFHGFTRQSGDLDAWEMVQVTSLVHLQAP